MACFLVIPVACDDSSSRTGNNSSNINNAEDANNTNNTTNNNTNNQTGSDLCAGVDDAAEYTWSESAERPITLDGSTITAGAGVTVSGTTATITAGGVYRITGALADGRLVVNAGVSSRVVLILDDVSLTSATDAPIEVLAAGKTIIHLPAGTTSTLTDAATRPGTTSANATLHASGDLAFDGAGALIVHGNYNDGIRSMKGLTVHGGTLTVDGQDDGLVAEDCVVIHAGTFSIDAVGGDGVRAENSVNTQLGFVHVLDGNFTIDAGNDGLQAESDLLIEGGTFELTCAGGATGVASDLISAKGLKAGNDLAVTGGTFVINSADDGLHSNKSITIEDGDFTIATLDDGLHAETTLVVEAGTIDITRSYEGLEAVALTINGGTIHVVSSDDGLNAAGDTSPKTLTIHGGYIAVTADGDGLDINGSVTMTGGTLIVHGPTRNDNGALDYDQTFVLTGGIIVAAGSSGMAMAPSSTSTEYSVLFGFNTALSAGTLIHLETSTGTQLLTFSSTKAVQSVCFSSPELGLGAYAIYTGGSYSPGGQTDGVYAGGAYAPGTLFRSFTVSSVVTKVNIQSGPPGGKMMPPPPPFFYY
ncbi:carbohydrate-binding domain-containing protein [Myxococcota bacterium]|nr:carbohydrate-binding domain-containing protein [Myxococcota bacterium]